jgi:hypothetical protein
MKNLMFIFILLPIFIFGQTEINVDSVSLIEYSGSYPEKKLGYQTVSKDGIFKKNNRKKSTVEQSPKKELSEEYPNYDKDRDMPLPVLDKTILDSEGRFHPSAKWETYQTFPSDSVAFLLDILNCKIPEIDTIRTADDLGNEILTFRHREPQQTGMCFDPRLGILIRSKGEIVDFYSVCFKCSSVKKGVDNGYNFEDCIFIDDLKMEIKRLSGL